MKSFVDLVALSQSKKEKRILYFVFPNQVLKCSDCYYVTMILIVSFKLFEFCMK